MTKNKVLAGVAGVFVLSLLAACGGGKDGDTAELAPHPVDDAALLDAVIAGSHRSAEERARDVYRHPKETLAFFGLEPDMTVVEVYPGGGWYTQIIAPFIRQGGGTFYAAHYPAEGASANALTVLQTYRDTYVADPDLYGAIEVTSFGEGHHIAPEGSADMVLTFRNVHNWQMSGTAQNAFNEFYRALKPGGILGVVEHRADGSNAPHDGTRGYVYTDDVKALAAAAGFDFDASSEVNANPKDSKDHPFGVWTLPPSRRSSEVRGQEDPAFNRTPYDAIGESDRMTLKFRKPIAADGALFE